MLKAYKDFISLNPAFIGNKRHCNICGFRFAAFESYGVVPRECRCPVCKSMERQRHLYIHLLSIFPMLKDKNILHFAPEKCFRYMFAQSEARYFDCDIDARKATYQVDITNISFDDAFFDYIICVHVLEHIIDDLRAMRELFRVLAPGGKAFLSVPLYSELYEDYSITDPQEREKAFGQKDHVRKYDLKTFCARLKQAGFSVSTLDAHYFPLPLREEALLRGIFILAEK
ncbi:MAG: class I SAM-dependent methyltransferase [Desulfovibrionaceae bacterium]|nr:class I SAM-dependent methyltransferase [Desulfovibrionaceae bacterium]